MCLERSKVHVKNHCSVKVCEKLARSWFFIGVGLTLAGLTFMVLTIQNTEPDICKWHVWLLYFLSTAVLIFSVGLTSRSLANCISFVISECEMFTGFADIPSVLSIEDQTESPLLEFPHPAPSTSDVSENPCGQKMVVYAEVHKAQDSCRHQGNGSLCNFLQVSDSDQEVSSGLSNSSEGSEVKQLAFKEHFGFSAKKVGETKLTQEDSIEKMPEDTS